MNEIGKLWLRDTRGKVVKFAAAQPE